MKLPFEIEESHKNLLPYDGEVLYFSKVQFHKAPQVLYEKLLSSLKWQNDVVTMFGKTHITKRKMALYGNSNLVYTYSNQANETVYWHPELLKLKKEVEKLTSESFNCCLCNLYHDGTEGMGYHADNEKDLIDGATIASLSFGAERYFKFKHRTSKETIQLLLENGSLLLMKKETQKHWLHSLPKSKKIKSGRINLTFRKLK